MWKIDQGSQTGSTSAAYTAVLDWKTAELGAKTMLLKNTGAGASLKYRLTGYAADNGIGRELAPETTLETGEVAEFQYQRHWARLLLELKNGTGAANYQLDYSGQGA